MGRAFDEVARAIEVVERGRGVELFKLLRCDVLFVVEGSHLLGLREQQLVFGQSLAFLLLQRFYAFDAGGVKPFLFGLLLRIAGLIFLNWLIRNCPSAQHLAVIHTILALYLLLELDHIGT